VDGVAPWLSDSSSAALPRCFVLGADKDFTVDQEGVRETAAYLKVQPYFFKDAYHDVMLGAIGSGTAKYVSDLLRLEK
jgi:hypothetical protein